ncbi:MULTISPECIES: LacI family DNA-binding transcriptional regulator [unclassified Pseudoclavibacter]|uniref:LacI family DNA-binding transcriptional regulator n=1 Tax=unclassified Pseudoclavibacter TaxID=2615177 RepID=UPI0015E317C4|nr:MULTISPECIES: LacI family DNA-binding transcriptional regulator [unclassified Pseudoclavibacter]
MIAKSEDVARHAGVSRGAVSQILNGRGQRFSEATRERVLAAAAELDYQPSAAGRALANGSSDFVIVLVPNTTFGSNLQGLFEGATSVLAEHGLTLVLHLSTESAAALGRLVAGIKPRAVISLVPFGEEERALLSSRSIVAIDPSLQTRDTTDLEIGRLQARHLISRGFDVLAAASLTDQRQDPFGHGRIEGILEVCAAAGLAAPLELHLGIDLDEATRVLDTLPEGRVGIACYNDDVALTLLSAARRAGKSVPGELGLIGMDNTVLSQVSIPRLTTIAYDLSQTASTIVAAVVEGLSLPKQDDLISQTPTFELNIGEST